MSQSIVIAKARAECHDAPIYASRGDGIWIGSCGECGASVCRINPRTGAEEWLDGASPWTVDDSLRPMAYRRESKHLQIKAQPGESAPRQGITMEPETSIGISIEGQLVREWFEYEADDLSIDGKRIQDLLEGLPVVDVQRRYSRFNNASSNALREETTNYGRVRLTIEVLR